VDWIDIVLSVSVSGFFLSNSRMLFDQPIY